MWCILHERVRVQTLSALLQTILLRLSFSRYKTIFFVDFRCQVTQLFVLGLHLGFVVALPCIVISRDLKSISCGHGYYIPTSLCHHPTTNPWTWKKPSQSVSLHSRLASAINLWKEPPRPPTPEPTIAKYTRDSNQVRSPDDWKEIEIRLVGTHPLWGHYLCVFLFTPWVLGSQFLLICNHRWNAALALASFLDLNRDLYVDRNVLELGAGGGLPSIVTLKNGARKVSKLDWTMTIAHLDLLPRW